MKRVNPKDKPHISLNVNDDTPSLKFSRPYKILFDSLCRSPALLFPWSLKAGRPKTKEISKGCFVDKNVHVYCLCQQVKPSRHAEQKSENQCVPLPTWRKYARSTSSQVPSNPNSSASTVKVQLSPFSWIHTDQNTFKFLDFITLPLSLSVSLLLTKRDDRSCSHCSP